MSESIQISVRVHERMVAVADGLREYVQTETGSEATRADVIRRAMMIGLRELARRRSRATFDTELFSEHPSQRDLDEAEGA